jgi:hypothetical protein
MSTMTANGPAKKTKSVDAENNSNNNYFPELDIFLENLNNFIRSKPSTVDSFVIQVEAEYGMGKTFMSDYWADKNKGNDDIRIIKINAWDNDFELGALDVILLNLYQSLSSWRDRFQDAATKTYNDHKNKIGGLIKVLTAHAAIVHPLLAMTIPELKNIKLPDLKEKNTDINLIKEKIRGLSSKVNLVFVIDELDRCRPNFSLEILETMKHFFNSTGAIFILNVSNSYLFDIIKHQFGLRDENAHQYFEKFIDKKLSLPKYSFKLYTAEKIKMFHLNEKCSINCFFKFSIEELINFIAKKSMKNFNKDNLKELNFRQINKLLQNLNYFLNMFHKTYPDNKNALVSFYALFYFSARLCNIESSGNESNHEINSYLPFNFDAQIDFDRDDPDHLISKVYSNLKYFLLHNEYRKEGFLVGIAVNPLDFSNAISFFMRERERINSMLIFLYSDIKK